MSTEKYSNNISSQAAKLEQLIKKTIELRITEKLQKLQWIPNEEEYLKQLMSEESIDKFVTDEGEWFNKHFKKNIYKIAYPEALETNHYSQTRFHSKLLFLTTIKQKLGLIMHKKWEAESAKRATTAAIEDRQEKGEFKQYNILNK